MTETTQTEMNQDSITHVEELLDTIRVESADAFRLGGRIFPLRGNTTTKGGETEGSPEQKAAPFVGGLTNVLYRYVYSRPYGGALPCEADEGSDPAEETLDREAYRPDDALLARLSAANTTSERWEHGWTISQIHSNGQAQVRRGHLRRLVWPGQFLSKDGPGAKPRVGTEVSLFYAKESIALQPGFYYLFGETPEEQAHSYGIMRFYWNVDPRGAAPLIGAVGRYLNRFQVPFRMKCAVALAEYERTDAAVLYVPKGMTRFVFGLLPDLHREVEQHLAIDVPFFTRRLAPGLALAEDPGTGESFGQHRCRLVAEAVWNSFLRQEQDTAPRLAELRRLFSEHGVHPDHTHLNSGSLEWYEFSEVTNERSRRRAA